MIKHISIFLLFLLVGCAPQTGKAPQPTQTSPASEEIQAAHALDTFLRLLHQKDYAAAVPLYGSDYGQLQDWNPDINPSDYATLWERACEQNGLQCLEPRSAGSIRQETDAYIFQVEFNNPDGSLFVRGPCCGANETEMPPVSQFEFTVTRNSAGSFVVMNTPPYVP